MSQGASGRAVAALILGILGIVTCFVCGIVAIVIGNSELDAIRMGVSSPEGEGFAKAGVILGWVSLAWGVLALLGFLCIGGLSVMR